MLKATLLLSVLVSAFLVAASPLSAMRNETEDSDQGSASSSVSTVAAPSVEGSVEQTEPQTHPQTEPRDSEEWDALHDRDTRDQLFSIAQKHTDPFQLRAIKKLWKMPDGQELNRMALRSVFFRLIEAARIPEGQNLNSIAFDAVRYLWYSNDAQQSQNRTDLSGFLLEVAGNFDHPFQIGALRTLWCTTGDGQETTRRSAISSILVQIAQNRDKSNEARQFEAIYMLWACVNPREQSYYNTLLPMVRKMAGC